ncbi:glutamate decarboxylase [Kitasatospora sp. YST-16]|uniref:glutamate decarboxylase n=1 Tax=Kitasatospora sp. YST-16 TaxID=2998080 RepID=UPI0022840197|nr:glutamate decarboxylase [Kitasatospora sp. YST-16]WAL71703.1 glutamate decarboxylase [Kitasatospora sp. YST-16]WNW37743.1 glutamate decarboxylase [Streptomyces sp. Li-HN-5-13]
MALHKGQGEEERRLPFSPLHVLTDPLGAMQLAPALHRLPQVPVPPDVAYQLIHDELMLDGNARLNLATFVTTQMDEHADRLMSECRDKNMIDKDEYPQTAELERRCVAILADLWHAPDPAAAVGCSTTGSSEACMLAGMALKRRWTARNADRYAAGARPNLVMGVNVQVCWEKFCNFWEVEARLVPMEGERFHLSAEEAVAHCDENTIGVVGILGSTFDGSYEPIAEICAALDAFQERTGLDVPVHVDGASGGMVAPFLDPELVWDFRLPRVASINCSGHKYGLVYPGVGWALWRDGAALPEELVFKVNYLGGEMPTFALNFSRPGAEVVAQYYSFLRLGFTGYRAVQQACRDVAGYLVKEIAGLGPFRMITKGDQLPVFAFTTTDGCPFDVFDVSRRLRERGWQVPAYTFPEGRTDLAVLRVVCRNGFTRDLADLLLADLRRLLPELERQPAPLGELGMPRRSGFHH